MAAKLDQLHPDMYRKVTAAIGAWEVNGLDVLITCTYRSYAQQDELYAQGRTKPGRIVTNAMAGKSMHNCTLNGRPASMAIDVVPLRYGKCVWGTSGNGIDDNPSDDEKDDLELWQRVAAIGKACGLDWAGDWKKFREFPHFQLPGVKL